MLSFANGIELPLLPLCLGVGNGMLSFQHHRGSTAKSACRERGEGCWPAVITLPPPLSSEPAVAGDCPDHEPSGEAVHIAIVGSCLVLHLEQKALKREKPAGYFAVRIFFFCRPLEWSMTGNESEMPSC